VGETRRSIGVEVPLLITKEEPTADSGETSCKSVITAYLVQVFNPGTLQKVWIRVPNVFMAGCQLWSNELRDISLWGMRSLLICLKQILHSQIFLDSSSSRYLSNNSNCSTCLTACFRCASTGGLGNVSSWLDRRVAIQRRRVKGSPCPSQGVPAIGDLSWFLLLH